MDIFERARQLPEKVKNLISPIETDLNINKIGFMYGLDEEKIGIMEDPLSLIFVGDIKLEEYPSLLEKDLQIERGVANGIAYEITKKTFALLPEYFTNASGLLKQWEQLKTAPIISEEDAYKKVLESKPWIIEQKEEEAAAAKEEKKIFEEQKNKVNLSLRDALKEYPKIGEQSVTMSQLKLKYFPDLVKPSIKNWITDFHDNMGAGKHSTIDRGNYLFHSENGKKLTPLERQKLSMIFKSLDEASLLAIDPEKEVIIFENVAADADFGNDRSAEVRPEKSYIEQSQQAQAKKPYSSPNFASKPDSRSVEEIKTEPRGFFAGFLAKKKNNPEKSQSEKTIGAGVTQKDQFQISQEKPRAENDNYFGNFASSSVEKKHPGSNIAGSEQDSTKGAISFSSPQKFSVEQQDANPLAKEAPQVDQQKPNMQAADQFSQPQRKRVINQESQWQIKPSGYHLEEITDGEGEPPKAPGNIVDLRN